MKRRFTQILFCLLLSSLLLWGLAELFWHPTVIQAANMGACRFGITSTLGEEGYDIASLGVGSYLDWGAGSNPVLPAGIEYIRVLRLRDDIYASTLINLAGWVQANKGAVWLVGNEPDTTYGGQDGLTAEAYAERYHTIATQIRSLDATARIGFGTVVQPTPIRMRYLDRAWEQLALRAGSDSAASALIDLWSIHSFILNEQLNSWGAGIPMGFEGDHSDAVIIGYSDTHSNVLFENRIRSFRSWMALKGERNKPLWITEYGSLFPPTRPDLGVTDQNSSDFLVGTFNFLLGGVDSQTGLASDDNRLVQRWFWYSLNDYRYNFGGSLFDPDNGKAVTLVGETFRNYQSLSLAQPDLFPKSLSILPISYVSGSGLVKYQLRLLIGNALSADTSSPGVVNVYDGDPAAGGTLIAGPIEVNSIQRCGGTRQVTVTWAAVTPLTQHTIFVSVTPSGVTDANLGNNQAEFLVFTELPILTFLPNISK